MDRSVLRRHLERAKEQVAQGQRLIERQQRQLVAELKRDGHPSETAKKVLAAFETDGTQPSLKGYTGGPGDKALSSPWGVSIDGNDDIWVANFWGRGIVLMAGAEPKGVSAEATAGDVLHVFQGGTIQMLTDVVVDPAGNVWAANNWNNLDAAVLGSPSETIWTLGWRVGLHRHLWRSLAGESSSHGTGAPELTWPPVTPAR